MLLRPANVAAEGTKVLMWHGSTSRSTGWWPALLLLHPSSQARPLNSQAFTWRYFMLIRQPHRRPCWRAAPCQAPLQIRGDAPIGHRLARHRLHSTTERRLSALLNHSIVRCHCTMQLRCLIGFQSSRGGTLWTCLRCVGLLVGDGRVAEGVVNRLVHLH